MKTRELTESERLEMDRIEREYQAKMTSALELAKSLHKTWRERMGWVGISSEAWNERDSKLDKLGIVATLEGYRVRIND